MHNLRNNASHFQKELEIRNSISARDRNEIDRQKDRMCEDSSNHKINCLHEEERCSTQNDRVHDRAN